MNMESGENAETTLEVCFGPECSDCDGRELFEELKLQGLNVVIGDCKDQCPNAPLVYVNNRMVVYATPDRVQDKIRALQLEQGL